MSNDATLDEDDLAFERRLLGAGRAETLPLERTQAALLRFAAAVGALPAVALDGSALCDSAAASVSRSRYFATAKWLVLGAMAGSAATFAWLELTTPARPSTTQAAPLSAQLHGLLPRPAVRVPTAAVVLGLESPKLAAGPAERAMRVASGAARAPRAGKSGADLAAEVSAIDSIRTALSIGAWRDAEQRLAGYRREFAQGALRSEADVLAVELLVAQGHRQAATSAAERFISQRPRDPQVARVRALVQ